MAGRGGTGVKGRRRPTPNRPHCRSKSHELWLGFHNKQIQRMPQGTEPAVLAPPAPACLLYSAWPAKGRRGV